MAGLSKSVLALALALAPVTLSDDVARTEVDHLVAAIAATRHLAYHGTLPLRVLDRAEAARESERLDDQAAADPAARLDTELLRRLGLVGPARASDDSDDDAIRPARGEPGDPATSPRFDAVTGRLWVPSFVPLEAQRIALAHEVAHAMADQRFSLRRLMEVAADGRSRLTGDARRARLAVVEGDAMLTGLEVLDPRETFLGAHQRSAMAARLRAAAVPEAVPGWSTSLAAFTHVDGLLFVERARAHHPWSAVDALWTDPPSSTEQILHPEKYESCEAPVALEPAALPALPGLGRPAATDVLGELVARAWLSMAWPAEVAERAAAGWGGDRAAIYEAPPGADGGAAWSGALAWLTAWDDAGEADDFAHAARRVVERLAEQGSAEPPSQATGPERVVFSSGRGLFGVARRGDAVAVLIAAPEGSEPALDTMLAAWRRVEPTRRGASRPRPAALPGCLRRDRAGGSE